MRRMPPEAPFVRVDIMTIRDYPMVMKQVGIADLKAHLSEYLQSVRRGHTLGVMDRKTLIARITPSGPSDSVISVRQPAPSAPSLAKVALPPRLSIDRDVVELLMEERQGRR